MSNRTSPALLFAAVVTVGAAVAFLTSYLMPRDAGAAAAERIGSDSVEQRLAAIEAALERLEAMRPASAPLSSTPDPARTSAGLDAPAVRALVEQILAERDDAGAAGDAADTVDVGRAVHELTANRMVGARAMELWEQIREAGKLDEVVEAFRERAMNSPNSADAQCDYGVALVQQLQSSGDDMMKTASLARLADRAFDEALDIDDGHWSARFNKAISLSFWPQAMGRGPEAVENFETLIAQQEAMPPEPRFANTYFYLGNMHAQNGRMDEARKIWQRGAVLFPNNEQLAEKLR